MYEHGNGLYNSFARESSTGINSRVALCSFPIQGDQIFPSHRNTRLGLPFHPARVGRSDNIVATFGSRVHQSPPSCIYNHLISRGLLLHLSHPSTSLGIVATLFPRYINRTLLYPLDRMRGGGGAEVPNLTFSLLWLSTTAVADRNLGLGLHRACLNKYLNTSKARDNYCQRYEHLNYNVRQNLRNEVHCGRLDPFQRPHVQPNSALRSWVHWQSYSAEVSQLPHFPSPWIRGLFQRDRKPQGQDGGEATSSRKISSPREDARLRRTTYKQYRLHISRVLSIINQRFHSRSNVDAPK